MLMNKSISKIRPLVLEKLRTSAIRIGIFGSFARDEATKNSDVDILVELKKTKSFFDLVRLERELSAVLKRKVDLLTYDSVNPLLKERIFSEEVRIL